MANLFSRGYSIKERDGVPTPSIAMHRLFQSHKKITCPVKIVKRETSARLRITACLLLLVRPTVDDESHFSRYTYAPRHARYVQWTGVIVVVDYRLERTCVLNVDFFLFFRETCIHLSPKYGDNTRRGIRWNSVGERK